MLFEVWKWCSLFCNIVAVHDQHLLLLTSVAWHWFGFFFLWAIFSLPILAWITFSIMQGYAPDDIWGDHASWPHDNDSRVLKTQLDPLNKCNIVLLQGVQGQTVGDIPDYDCGERYHLVPLQCWMLSMFTLCWWPIEVAGCVITCISP